MITVLYVLVAILILGLIVTAHEFGHYIVGRLTGMAILEFSVGFGPKIFGFRRGEIDYSLRAIPLGGYCAFLGEDEENPDPRAMRNMPVWKRFLTILAGPAMNFVLAFLAAVILIWGWGGSEGAPVVGAVVEESPAAEAGLLEGDVVAAIDGEALTCDDEGAARLVELIRAADASRALALTVDRGGETLEIDLVPAYNEEAGAYQIGILLGYIPVRYGFFQSVRLAGPYIGQITRMMLNALRALVTTGEGLKDTMGPVGIISFVSQEVRQGFDMALYLVIIISLNLGIMNLIPFPGLDGGRLLFLVVEAIRRRPVDPKKEGWVHAVGVIALLGLIVVITYRDIVRLFTGG